MQFGAWAESWQLQRTTTETILVNQPTSLQSILAVRPFWGASPCYSLPGPCRYSQLSLEAAQTCFNPSEMMFFWVTSHKPSQAPAEVTFIFSLLMESRLNMFKYLWINSQFRLALLQFQGTRISRLFGRIRQRKWNAKPWWSTCRPTNPWCLHAVSVYYSYTLAGEIMMWYGSVGRDLAVSMISMWFCWNQVPSTVLA